MPRETRKDRRAGGALGHDETRALLMRAIAAHQAGALGEARELYNSVIAGDRAQFDALHMLGVLEAQSQNIEEALRLFERALKVNPRSADALTNKGRLLTELRRHED